MSDHNSNSFIRTSGSPTFKVSRVSYQHGHMETVNLDTTQLMKTANIYARDLFFTLNLTSKQERNKSRRIASRRTVSAILPRKQAVLLNFGNVRAVVGLQDVLLLDAHLPAVRDFAKQLSDTFAHVEQLEGEPPELVVLESVLRDAVDSFNRRMRLFEPIVEAFLEKVDNNDITSPDASVHQLAPLKDSLQSFGMIISQSQECLEDLLNHDDEMLDLLLTEQSIADKSGQEVEFERHEHVEVLLGVYARQISNIKLEINYLLSRLQSKQEFVALALSGYRNRMVRMNVHLGIAGLGLGLSTAVAGFFGMNLVSGLEEAPHMFNGVVLGSVACSAVTSMTCLSFLSGSIMRERAAQRLEEIETMTSALDDIGALDQTLKSTFEDGNKLDKEGFKQRLKESRHSKEVSDAEVELLFDVFDRIKDGTLTSRDFGKPTLPAEKP